MKVFVLSTLLLSQVSCLDILMFNPCFGHSHMRFMGRISQILTEAGHNVVEVRSTVDDTAKFDNIFRPKEVHSYPVHPLVHDVMESSRSDNGFMKKVWDTELGPAQMAQIGANMTMAFVKSCEHLLFETDAVAKLKGRHFDLGISESFDFCGHAFFEMLNLSTTISTSSSNLMDHQAIVFGVPRAPSYVPGGMSDSPPEMTLSERFSNLLSSYFGAGFFLGICDAQTEVVQKHIPTFPDLRDVQAKSAFLFTNMHPFLDYPHPTLAKVIDIGGIHLPDHKTAPKLSKVNVCPVSRRTQEWDDILNRKDKVVLISFGSVAKSFEMPRHYKQGIIDTAKRMPDVQFIWKYEKDDLKDLPPNLYLSKWTPQTSLLADKRLDLFVTHGGLASTIEIAHSGMPTITIAMFGDQMRNGRLLKYRGTSEQYDKMDIPDSVKLSELIKKMLKDDSYRKNAEDLATLLLAAPFKPKDLLLKNVEFAGRFGGLSQLDPHGRQLSFIAYFLLDVFAVALAIALAILLIVLVLLKLMYNRLRKSFQKTKHE